MDRVATINDLEREIEALMREQGLDRVGAIIQIGQRQGAVLGNGDLVCLRPLSDDQRQRIGLGRHPKDVLSELGELADDAESD